MGFWNQRALLVCSLAVIFESVQGQFTCEDGWKNVGSRCFKEGHNMTTQFTASLICREQNAVLWRPQSFKENNQFINATDTDGTYSLDLKKDRVWWEIMGNGLLLHTRTLDVYNNFGNRSLGNGCVVFVAATGAWTMSNCHAQMKFRCEKEATCVPGLFGSDCENECHCAGEPCSPVSGFCKGGCKAGWSGFKCNQKMKKAYGMFYCLEEPNGMHEVIFRSYLHNVNYREISAIDDKGNVLTSCGKNRFDFYEGIATIRINGSGNSFEPDCGARLVNNDTTRWTFLFRQYANLSTEYDVIFQITCNWKNVEKTQQSAKVAIHGRHGRLRKSTRMVRHQVAEHLSPKQTRVNAEVKLVDADSGDEIANATIGEKVKLVVEFKKAADIAVSDIAPYSCVATSLDGKQSIEFMDKNGCPVTDSPVYLDSSAVRKDGRVVYTSREFQVFSFPGHQHVVFTCQIHICFDHIRDCHNRCSSRNRKKKRAVSDVENQVSGTLLDIKGGGEILPSLAASN